MSVQARLFASPETPAEYAEYWGVRLLDEIPVPGPATSADWLQVDEPSREWPGRNHPRAGAWLLERYASTHPEAHEVHADPFIGVGGLWLAAAARGYLYGCEVEEDGAKLARKNLADWYARIQVGDARRWAPPTRARLVLGSPPFEGNHSSGAGEHQVQLREEKGLHAVMEFGDSDANIGRMRGAEYWAAIEAVYRQVRTYAAGLVVWVLRNRIEFGGEVDAVGDHIGVLRAAGFELMGVHPRDLVRPTGFQQMKLSRDPETPWTKWEWTVVGR